MAFGYKLWFSSITYTPEFQFILYDADSLGNGVYRSLKGDLVVKEHGFVEADVLTLYHHFTRWKQHPHKVADKGIQDVAVHHATTKTLALRKSHIGMQRIEVTTARLECMVHFRGHLISVLYFP